MKPRKTQINGRSVVRRSQSVAATATSEGVFLVDERGGRLYNLDLSGTAVWRLLAAPGCVDDLCHRLTAEFAADPAVLRRDVVELLEELRRVGLVDVSREMG